MIRFPTLFKAAIAAWTAVSFTTAAALPVQAAGLPSQLLFVETAQGSINVYSLDNPQAGTVAVISGLIAAQDQMAVDKQNDLFVVNTGIYANDLFVSKFAPPYNAPPVILSTSWKNTIYDPVGVAANAQGTVYVSSCGVSCGGPSAVILVYPKGATSPVRAIGLGQFNNAFDSLAGLGIDKQGNLYAVAFDATTKRTDVIELPAGSSSPRELNLNGLATLNGGNGVSLNAFGNLYVSNPAFSDYILAFKPGQTSAFQVIDDAFGPPVYAEPRMLDVGPDNNLYVANSNNLGPPGPFPAVYGFKPGASNPFVSVGTTSNQTQIQSVTTAPNIDL